MTDKVIIFINPYSGAGRALEKWNRIRPSLGERLGDYDCRILLHPEDWHPQVAEMLDRGKTSFVAGGGDGTVNILLNALLTQCTPVQRTKIRLGAIGLGSSNDFHKPFQMVDFIAGIPCKIDLARALPRDIGVLDYSDNGKVTRRFFMANASLGATANANYFFNHPDTILSWLKQHSVTAAIYYAALTTIMHHRNLDLELDAIDVGSSPITNIAILKNPHFSGSLHYKTSSNYQNGLFEVFCARSMNRWELIRLLTQLANGGASLSQKLVHRTIPHLNVSAKSAFAVEFDGEVVRCGSCQFSILQHYLQVCQ